MAIIQRTFNMNLGPAYTNLAGTMQFQIVSTSGVILFGPITGTGITEGSFGPLTATGSYNITPAGFDSTWAGSAQWYEPQNGFFFEQPFTATQSTDNASLLAALSTLAAAVKAKTDNLPSQPAAVGSAMGLADNAIKNTTFQSGTTIPGGVTLSPDQLSTLVASILRDNDPANQAVPDSLGGVVKSSKGSYDSCYVDVSQMTPSTKKFQIRMAQASIDAGRSLPTGIGYKGLWLMFNGSANLAPSKLRIADYQLNEENLATVWFTEPFYDIPADGSTCEVG